MLLVNLLVKLKHVEYRIPVARTHVFPSFHVPRELGVYGSECLSTPFTADSHNIFRVILTQTDLHALAVVRRLVVCLKTAQASRLPPESQKVFDSQLHQCKLCQETGTRSSVLIPKFLQLRNLCTARYTLSVHL